MKNDARWKVKSEAGKKKVYETYTICQKGYFWLAWLLFLLFACSYVFSRFSLLSVHYTQLYKKTQVVSTLQIFAASNSGS